MANKELMTDQEQKSSHYESIFKSSNDGILIVNEQGVIKMVNPAAERMFGYASGELLGKKMEMLLPEKLRERHVAYRQIYSADPQPRSMGIGRDLWALRKNGLQFPIEVSLSNSNINGQPIVVAFVIDITRRKKIEEKLKKSEEQLITYASELEQRVKKRTKDLDITILELEQTNEKLQQQVKERKRIEKELRMSLEKEKVLNELKSRFVSMASHEFRTPLSTILSSVSLIKKYIESEQTDKTDKHISRVKGSVKNLTDILDDFLSIGKLEEGRVEADFERVDVNGIIEELLGELDGILKDDQKFVFRPSPDVIDVYTDEKLIRKVMINLLSNAAKYSPEGKEVLIKTKKIGTTLEIEVIDYGMGIPEDEQGHMFERFFRARNAMNIKGTGLGLNIVKKYMELLQGQITFTSKLGEGSTFIIALPTNPN
jgi:PAS domain S-box-containing protein